ncbi:2-succinyl-5-enolpyruvyl-6-hydroxy-3-cyclohexene-1-carboxylate synthase [Bacillus pakistanensis]|uniref:2-succinyl-5-enolpyruvyl-6-hydroxy-3-cyclohexene-1-carboxylate synthase n=1 Tax=Rossellomorea pakistanensis TaxID=992288 RepID=A0ABS2NKH5_9BACI|nr:2-succinyl-5-enolpyruvyl-6-hydroxy-3-cyclohexene-1-carboxylic-acid synthase [Bacillus pakistanensis]MBM7588351.1 2-succinyl-5-enolpyruvyl-6-hydroxy-3-cyclohexene-1-carboxylate synthase [Bacillus pakistanensis]
MKSNHQEDLTRYVAVFIEEMVANGVKKVVISPGSRSTPFALLLAEHPEIQVFINVDERSAAFFALGIAKAENQPVAMLCTSGTASANYYPAIIEAKYSRVPLVVLTADRPHELREVGAPQAIDQIQMYGRHVKWSIDMPLPESSSSILSFAKSTASRGIGISRESPAGPVHFNFPFREPLVPNLSNAYSQPPLGNVLVTGGERILSKQQSEIFRKKMAEKEKGLIICGPQLDRDSIDAILSFSELYNFPILADPLSGIRSGAHRKTTVVDSYDSFLRTEVVKNSLVPDVVIRFGAMPVSKALSLYLKHFHNLDYWVIDEGGQWLDPIGKATEMIHCSTLSFCESLTNGSCPSVESKWLNKWLSINEQTKRCIIDSKCTDMSEGEAVRSLIDWLPDSSTLFVSNSMPIRDVDTYFLNTNKQINVLANRGANGIDGVVSTALGVSTSKAPTFLLIGDLAFFHDMNGLLAGKMHNLNVKIIVLNNNGGGIFSYLPQAKEDKHFESLFGTPMDLEFSSLSALYHADYYKAIEMDEFSTAFKKSCRHSGVSIIEVVTNRGKNTEQHRKLWNLVSREIEKEFR